MLELTRSDPEALKSYDAQVIVGEHAMAGTSDGFVSQTHSDNTALRMNNQYVGEIEWQTWLLGHYDVPTIMVTGDAAAIRETKTFFPEIVGVIVKTAKSRGKAECLPPDEARKMIEEVATKALSNLRKFRPHRLCPPIKLDLIFDSSEPTRFGSYMPGAKQTDDRTVTYIAEDYPEAIWAHMSLVMLGTLHALTQDIGKLFELLPEKSRKKFNDETVEKISKWATEPSTFLSTEPPKNRESK